MNGRRKSATGMGEKPEEVERMDCLEFIARVTSHIPDKGQVTVRYYGLYGNAHRGKVQKAQPASSSLRRRARESPAGSGPR
jgi:hypothetical protein